MAEVGTFKTTTNGPVRVYEWGLAENGEGNPVLSLQMTDRSYAMFGTWDGATVTLEGGWDEDDKTNAAAYQTLHESDNTTAISNTADTCGVVLENPVWVRPKLINAGAATDIIIVLVAR